jgi:putative membrane protein
VAELRGRPDVVFADALLTFLGIAVVGAVFVLALDWYAADFEIEDI